MKKKINFLLYMITIQYTKKDFIISQIFENLDKLKLYTIYDLKKYLNNFNPIYVNPLNKKLGKECKNTENLNKFHFEILYYHNI
jgi:hypothetical protein